jgi:hypothetical protein
MLDKIDRMGYSGTGLIDRRVSTLQTTQTTHLRIYLEEQVVDGKPLGRHVNHDPRSLNYPVRTAGPKLEVKPTLWPRVIPILDQGAIGSCTGNALTGALGSKPLHDLPIVQRLSLDESYAIGAYSDATKIDSYRGEYPPTDTGSDGLSVAKVAVSRKLASGYVHAFSLDDLLQAIMKGPSLIGSHWYESMDQPDSAGAISVSGAIRGGHEYLCRGADSTKNEFFCDNSWTAQWGNKGSFIIPFDAMTRLLAEQGDATLVLPASTPAPTPENNYISRNFLADDLAALNDWADHPHIWHKATVAAKAWKRAT